MRTLVAAQVDPLDRARNPIEEGRDELVRRADEREDGPVVIGVRVDVEQIRAAPEGDPEGVDHRPVAPLGEVRHRFERERHRTNSMEPASGMPEAEVAFGAWAPSGGG